MSPSTVEILGALIFGVAVIHTFATKRLLDWSHHFPKGSAAEAFLHLASEIEVVFGLWAGVFLFLYGLIEGFGAVVAYQDSIHFTEPIFVFCIMVVAATKPVLLAAQKAMALISGWLARATRIPQPLCDYFTVLTLGPLSGSFITEPAAITVSALLLLAILEKGSKPFRYSLLGLLFVNVSIGGALTPYAAPPILMVAGVWKWDFAFVAGHLGWKAALAVIVNAAGFVLVFRKDILNQMLTLKSQTDDDRVPIFVTLMHHVFLALLVLSAHHPNVAMGLFLFFLGFTTVSSNYQSPLRLRESLLVAFFLGGIMVFGTFQKWWLEPLLGSLSDTALFLGAAALTAVTDNAALTYLGAQVPNLTESSKYFLVAGAISGGGLTIIANAPNAAGYSLLQGRFRDGFSPLALAFGALPFTVVALIFLGVL